MYRTIAFKISPEIHSGKGYDYLVVDTVTFMANIKVTNKEKLQGHNDTAMKIYATVLQRSNWPCVYKIIYANADSPCLQMYDIINIAKGQRGWVTNEYQGKSVGRRHIIPKKKIRLQEDKNITLGERIQMK
jgi:hypothetical protein